MADFNQMTEELMREAGILQSLEQTVPDDNQSSEKRDEDCSGSASEQQTTEEQQTAEEQQTSSQQNIEQTK